LTGARDHVTVGISDHVAGPELPTLIARMNASNPQLLLEIRIGSSNELLRSYDQRELDTVLVRFRADRDDGELIAHEAFGWFASPDWQYRSSEPLPVATLAEPCGVRMLSSDLLDRAGVAWTPSFVGGGVAAVSAAVMAGLGVAAMAQRMLPFGAVDVGARLGLPPLPRLPIVLHTRARRGPPQAAIAALSAAYRRAARR
jgi:DNA-binding transcriptional LysR family regulator